MTDMNPTLAEFYQGWETYQNNLIQALSPLTEEQLALRSAPNLRSIGEIAAHIVGARARWFHNMLKEGTPETASMMPWGREGTPVPSAAELVQGLDATWRMMHGALQGWTPEHYAFVMTGERGGKPYALSRQWVIWHLIEHDLHHGGEISIMLGSYGIPGVDI